MPLFLSHPEMRVVFCVPNFNAISSFIRISGEDLLVCVSYVVDVWKCLAVLGVNYCPESFPVSHVEWVGDI